MSGIFEKLVFYFQYPFVWYALIVGVLIALCSSLLGVTLVLKRFSFIGDGLSHVAFGAIAASPLIFVLCPVRRSSTAQITVTGMTNSILLLKFSTDAMAIAPNATWDSPSPIKENRFSTSVTPRREEQSAISTPTIKAYHTNGY